MGLSTTTMKYNDMIFVFGSNLAGRHGKGAALHAKEVYGAEYGVGRGRTGQAYALPTKDEKLKSLSLEQVEIEIETFLDYASKMKPNLFVVTPVGCGLAGFTRRQLWGIFAEYNIPKNVVFSPEWFEYDTNT